MTPLPPEEVLFENSKPLPSIPACVHYAGSEKFIHKALDMQIQMGPVFDVACDCEDGASPGNEIAHAQMIVDILNSKNNQFNRAGVRIHDCKSPFWKEDVDTIVAGLGEKLAFITIPKSRHLEDVSHMVEYIRRCAYRHGIYNSIPIHVLIETPGAIQDIRKIARLPWLQALEFGLLDYISEHQGAIPESAMVSPGQFDNQLVVRAKTTIAATALENGLVASHNITLDFNNTELVYDDTFRAKNEFGCLRMWSIHPAQVAPILKAMAPQKEETTRAAEILLAGYNSNWAPINFKGNLHDRASFRYYWSVLKRAKQTGAPIPKNAIKLF